MNVENIKNEAYQLIDKYFMPAKAIIVKDFLNTYGFWDAPLLQNIMVTTLAV